jgi:Holliday junction resolvase RusA-like endonuclease
MEIQITIPGEPQSKGRPRFNTKTGNVYTPKTTSDAEDAIAETVKAHCVGWGEPPYAPASEVRVSLHFVSHKNPKNPAGRRDVDNCAKLVLDALNKLVWADDSQVSSLNATIVRGPEHGEPRTEITLVWDHDEEQAA